MFRRAGAGVLHDEEGHVGAAPREEAQLGQAALEQRRALLPGHFLARVLVEGVHHRREAEAVGHEEGQRVLDEGCELMGGEGAREDAGAEHGARVEALGFRLGCEPVDVVPVPCDDVEGAEPALMGVEDAAHPLLAPSLAGHDEREHGEGTGGAALGQCGGEGTESTRGSPAGSAESARR